MGELYGIDAASFQGVIDWAAVDATTGFGWEKVTQGTGYVNPYWQGPAFNAKAAMAARADATGFVPGGYLFLEAGNGAAQANHFANHAGDMAGFAVAVDVEPTGSSNPSYSTARDCVARLRAIYPGQPIVGYIPHWYWGNQDTTFVDVLWASNYVTAATAPPADMYQHVTPGQWAGYGGMAPELLQFTDKAAVAGVSGPVDCSAFRGTAAELTQTLLGTTMPSSTMGVDMTPDYLPAGTDGHPVALLSDKGRLVFFANKSAVVRVDWIGVGAASVDIALDYDRGRQGEKVPAGCKAAVVNRVIAGETSKGGTAGVGDGTEEISFGLTA